MGGLFNPPVGYLGTTVSRSELAEDALAVYHIPLLSCRNADYTPLEAHEPAESDFGFENGGGPYGWGGGSVFLKGHNPTGETITSTLCFEWCLPVEYVDGGEVQLRTAIGWDSLGGTAGTHTVDCEVYLQDRWEVAAAIRASSAKAIPESGATDTTFDDITYAGLSPGDRLVCFLRAILQETGGGAACDVVISKIEMLCDVKG